MIECKVKPLSLKKQTHLQGLTAAFLARRKGFEKDFSEVTVINFEIFVGKRLKKQIQENPLKMASFAFHQYQYVFSQTGEEN